MGKVFESIDDALKRWIGRQHMFFVATAPLDAEGLVNCSPKGGDSFRVLGEREVAYLDYTGSGVETIAHAKENGRIVIMFCAFEGPPKIVRLHGIASVHEMGGDQFDRLSAHFPRNPGARSIIHIVIQRISDSCGYAVPKYRLEGPRDGLDKWAAKQGVAGIRDYHLQRNARSLDGLPGLSPKPS